MRAFIALLSVMMLISPVQADIILSLDGGHDQCNEGHGAGVFDPCQPCPPVSSIYCPPVMRNRLVCPPIASVRSSLDYCAPLTIPYTTRRVVRTRPVYREAFNCYMEVALIHDNYFGTSLASDASGYQVYRSGTELHREVIFSSCNKQLNITPAEAVRTRWQWQYSYNGDAAAMELFLKTQLESVLGANGQSVELQMRTIGRTSSGSSHAVLVSFTRCESTREYQAFALLHCGGETCGETAGAAPCAAAGGGVCSSGGGFGGGGGGGGFGGLPLPLPIPFGGGGGGKNPPPVGPPPTQPPTNPEPPKPEPPKPEPPKPEPPTEPDPQDPSNPFDPRNPFDPNDPTGPQDPFDPIGDDPIGDDPLDPTNPFDPNNPFPGGGDDPFDPIGDDPIEPSDPSDPNNPFDPGNDLPGEDLGDPTDGGDSPFDPSDDLPGDGGDNPFDPGDDLPGDGGENPFDPIGQEPIDDSGALVGDDNPFGDGSGLGEDPFSPFGDGSDLPFGDELLTSSLSETGLGLDDGLLSNSLLGEGEGLGLGLDGIGDFGLSDGMLTGTFATADLGLASFDGGGFAGGGGMGTTAVPEPSSLALFGIATGIGALVHRRKRKKENKLEETPVC